MNETVQFTLLLQKPQLKKYKAKASELKVSTNEVIRKILTEGEKTYGK